MVIYALWLHVWVFLETVVSIINVPHRTGIGAMQVEKGEEADKIEEGNVTVRGIETTSFVLLSEIQRQLFNLPANKHNMCNQI